LLFNGFDPKKIVTPQVLVTEIKKSIQTIKNSKALVTFNTIKLAEQLDVLKKHFERSDQPGSWQSYVAKHFGKKIAKTSLWQYAKLYKFYGKYPNIQYCQKPLREIYPDLSLLFYVLHLKEYRKQKAQWKNEDLLVSHPQYKGEAESTLEVKYEGFFKQVKHIKQEKAKNNKTKEEKKEVEEEEEEDEEWANDKPKKEDDEADEQEAEGEYEYEDYEEDEEEEGANIDDKPKKRR